MAAEEILRRKPTAPLQEPDRNRVPLWDGHAAKRIAQIIVRGSTQAGSTWKRQDAEERCSYSFALA